MDLLHILFEEIEGKIQWKRESLIRHLPYLLIDTGQRREMSKMELDIDDLINYFPYPETYTELFNRTRFIKQALDANDHVVISMYKAKSRGQTMAMLSLNLL